MEESKQMVDDINKKILNVLLENSRLSYRQIAKKVGVSVATIMNRVNNLEKNKIIKKYSAVLDYEKLGYDVDVLIEMKISKGRLFEVEKQIASNPNVYAVYDTTGSFDATVVARFPGRRKMDSFLKKIQTYSFVERTNTKLILNTIKEEPMAL